jgi:protocatechuate 3,4-dioxygenase beta subunit
MDNDDQPIGTILNRRDVLKLLGLTGGAAILASCLPGQRATPVAGGAVATDAPATATTLPAAGTVAATESTAANLPACIVRPELTEGPYFVDEELNRSDIRPDTDSGAVSAGVPFELTFRVSQVGSSCAPLAGAQVDVWHCDAQGVYSDVQGNSANFLRGYQVTDENGLAHFLTVYPGWYPGRTPHIHFKIRTAGGYDFTSQLFFDDATSDAIYNLEGYRRGGTRTRNADDGIFQQAGDQLLLALTAIEEGYAAAFDIGLQL